MKGICKSMEGPDNWRKTIESIATNCRQLEYFLFQFHHRVYQDFNENESFQSLALFSGLRKLCFRNSDNSSQEINERITDLTPLKNCKNLLDLDLELFTINGNVFNGIESIVPQLRQLRLKCVNLEITDEVLESIAKLKYLIDIQLISYRIRMRSHGLRVLFNGCKRLQHFSAYYYYFIQRVDQRNHNKRMNKMIKSHPNIDFEFERKVSEF